MSDLDLVREMFTRNGRVNAVVLNSVTQAELSVSDGREGYMIGTHLGHCVEFRREWLRVISPARMAAVPDVMEGVEPTFQLRVRDPAELARAFERADAAALAAVEAALAEGRTLERFSHPSAFLTLIVVHDAHHRGQVVSLLRQGGRTTAQMDELERAIWPIWRE